MKQIVIAADLGGTNLRTAAIDRTGAILFRAKRATPRGVASAGEIARALVESARECLEKCAGFNVEAFAAAVPAAVDSARGFIIKAPNLPQLDGFQMARRLENELGVKAFLENDANAAAVGESWLGAAKGCRDSITITLGTGVGGGVIIDNKILRGRDGTAGEIGHICVEPFGAACGCGARGCLEQYASASAIVRIANELKTQHPQSELNRHSSLTARDVFQAGAKGDQTALEVFRQTGFYLGVALSGLINVLNPQRIVVGGGASAGWKLFAPHLKQTISERAYEKAARTARLAIAELGDDAGLIGAARIAFDNRD